MVHHITEEKIENESHITHCPPQEKKCAKEIEKEVASLLTLMPKDFELPEQLPSTLSSSFVNLTKLDLYQANLDETSFPSFLPTYLPNLEILFCMKNNFTVVPPILSSFPKLKMISFKSNQVKSIHPEALAPQLQWLILTDNQLKTLPSSIGTCTKLQKLMLSGNQIECLPKEISNCKKLELVRLSSNRLVEPPMDLLKLPALAWIALSDNPFLDSISEEVKKRCSTASTTPSSSSLRVFPNEELDDPNQGQILGKGASGITRQYNLQLPNTTTTNSKQDSVVAVKEFYANITSDGNPQMERLISFTTATLMKENPALIRVIGQTKKGNLIMELLSNYQVLANPPSLESCTRDVYKYGEKCDDDNNKEGEQPLSFITYTRMLHMVHNLLYTLKELHVKCSIAHGDFYGHNILCSTKDESQIWLTDFGAAFVYDRESEYGKLTELTERRAFGHLLREVKGLLTLMKVGGDNDNDEKEVVEFQRVLQGLIDSHEELDFEQLYSKWMEFYIKKVLGHDYSLPLRED